MRSRSLIALIMTTLCAACATPKGPPMHEVAAQINAAVSPAAEDVVVPGDVLSFQFGGIAELGAPDLSQLVAVQTDGTVTIPGVGTVVVAGRTPSQLTADLRDDYTEVLGPSPLFAVGIATQAPRRVHLLGSVVDPGPLILPPSNALSLVQAFAEAGGVPSQQAYLGSTLLVRWDPETQSQVSWVIDARELWWGEAETIFLRPGDVVYVPNTPAVEINTWIDLYMRRMIPFPRLFIYE